MGRAQEVRQCSHDLAPKSPLHIFVVRRFSEPANRPTSGGNCLKYRRRRNVSIPAAHSKPSGGSTTRRTLSFHAISARIIVPTCSFVTRRRSFFTAGSVSFLRA